jgi:ubiquinol-cytochrome c reductase cytochrome c subunit
MSMKVIVSAALVVGLFGGAARAAATGPDVDHGKALFKTFGCYECHGTVGQGGPGARLAPNTLPAEAIAAYIRNPAGEMPPYNARVVNDADIADIRAYLAQVPAPPPLSSLDQFKWK